MSQQPYRPLIWAFSILFFCICVAGLFYIKHTRELRVQAAQVRWENIQEKAATNGLHTDFDSFIEANSGEGPSLFSDFPSLVNVFDPSLNANIFSIDRLPDLKEVPSITATMTQLERTDALRLCLTSPLPESASEQEVYQAVLNSLSPITGELDLWKSAVFSSNNLGGKYFIDNFFFISAAPYRSTSNLLLLRSYCNWHLGNTNSSDIECVLKSSDLLYDYGHSLISLTVAIALDLSTSNTISAILHDSAISPDQSSRLVALMPTFDGEASLKSALKLEYLIQATYLTALTDNTGHPYIGNDEPLREKPQYLLEETRADIVEFQFAAYFGASAISTKGLLGEGADTLTTRIEAANYGESSEILLSTLSIGVGYYLEGAFKAQLSLETAKLSAYTTLYQRKFGHFPETLDDLAPEFLSVLPTTPYNGSDYNYNKPTTADEIPTISAVIRISPDESISAQWPEAESKNAE